MKIIDSNNLESVKTFLAENLNLCNCASSEVLELLYYTLTFADDIPNTSSKIRSIDFFPLGWGEWFIYFLEDKKLIWHGFNNTDFAIEESGRKLLEGLENFSKELGLNDYVLNDLADMYLQMGLYKVALKRIKAFIEKFPQDPVGYHTKSEILFGLQEYQKALDYINQSLELEETEEKQTFKKEILDKIE